MLEVIRYDGGNVLGVSSPTASSVQYLNGEDLYSHDVVQQLGLPHAAEAAPGLHLNQLQRFVSQNGGRG